MALKLWVLILFSLFCFYKRDDIALLNYEVAEDKSEIICETTLMTSMGYASNHKDKIETKENGDLVHKITFRGGIYGSNDGYKIKLKVSEQDSEIWFNRSDGEWELVLIKDKDTGDWIRENGQREWDGS